MELPFLQDVCIADKINKKAQQCIAPARCRIPECLQVHQPAKRRIKEINNGENKISCVMYMTSHFPDKNIASLWFIPIAISNVMQGFVNSQQIYRKDEHCI